MKNYYAQMFFILFKTELSFLHEITLSHSGNHSTVTNFQIAYKLLNELNKNTFFQQLWKNVPGSKKRQILALKKAITRPPDFKYELELNWVRRALGPIQKRIQISEEIKKWKLNQNICRNFHFGICKFGDPCTGRDSQNSFKCATSVTFQPYCQKKIITGLNVDSFHLLKF